MEEDDDEEEDDEEDDDEEEDDEVDVNPTLTPPNPNSRALALTVTLIEMCKSENGGTKKNEIDDNATEVHSVYPLIQSNPKPLTPHPSSHNPKRTNSNPNLNWRKRAMRKRKMAKTRRK